MLFHASALAADSSGVVVLVSSRESHDYYEKQHTSVLGHRPLIDRTETNWEYSEKKSHVVLPMSHVGPIICLQDTESRNLRLGHLEASDSEKVDIPWLTRQMAFCSSRAAFTRDKEGTCGMASDPTTDACHYHSTFQASTFLCGHHLDEPISESSPKFQFHSLEN